MERHMPLYMQHGNLRHMPAPLPSRFVDSWDDLEAEQNVKIASIPTVFDPSLAPHGKAVGECCRRCLRQGGRHIHSQNPKPIRWRLRDERAEVMPACSVLSCSDILHGVCK